ncbi:MAG: hypothetical protein HGA31_03550 [Candidatus Moranbacteria bacterium]|nr:hypothetical protein [Candidatus Moranbacteria bacterium]
MNRIEQQELNYRLYFAVAYDTTGRWTSGSLTRHYVFYATSDEEAWKICSAKIDSNIEEVNPNTLYRFRDDRTLEKVGKKPERSNHDRIFDVRPEIPDDPHRELKSFHGLSELKELLDLPVTKSRIRKTAQIEIA